MAKVTINGQTFNFDGDNISIKSLNGSIVINGATTASGLSGSVDLKVEGATIQSLTADGNVECKDVTGSVSAGGSVHCNNIGGSANAGGSIKATGTIARSLNAGGSIKITNG